MPKKTLELTNVITFRITDEQKDEWQVYLKAHPEFSSVSNFIRYAVGELIGERHRKDKKGTLKKKIEAHTQKIERLQEKQREILRVIAEKIDQSDKPPELLEYQRQTILNLIQERPRSEQELLRIVNMPEGELLAFINALLEADKIEQYKNKYRFKIG